MAKVTRKGMVDDYAELTAKHANVDISGPDAGIVQLESGDKAVEAFTTLKNTKDYYKPHQIYHAVFKPGVVGMVDPQGETITEERVKSHQIFRIPSKHHMQSKGTIMDCAKAHPDVFDAEPDYNSYIKVLSQEPVPAGTPLIIKYLKAAESESESRFGVYSSAEVHQKDVYNMEKTLRTMLCTKIIPKMGRSIMRDNSSKFDIKSTPVRDESGVTHQKNVTCTEVRKDGSICAGEFRRDGRGDYVCQNCGIIFQREDKFVAEDIAMGADMSDFEDDESIETTAPKADVELGTMSYGTMAAKERAIAKFEFQKRLELISAQEVAEREGKPSKSKIHEETMKKLVAQKKAEAKKFAKMNGHEVYEYKWTEKQSSYRKSRILAFAKLGNVTTGQLLEVLGIGSKQLYRLIAELEESGRITTKKVGKASVLTYNQ
jgi:hypothetical protein